MNSPAAPGPVHALDAAVAHAMQELGRLRVAPPRALLLLGTGLSSLPERLTHARSHELGPLGFPRPWHTRTLWTGALDDCPVWMIEDLLGDPQREVQAAPHDAAFPCWVAARAGARVLLHTSAGLGLLRDGAAGPQPGTLVALRDHVNLSGATPLAGLGGSQLGPLFPDVTRLHHVGLRRAALARAERRGLRAAEAVAACTLGPSLDTPAERRAWALLGADVAVQGLAAPLLGAAHAGLAALALVAVTEGGTEPADLARILAATQSATAALEDWVLGLGGDLSAAARALAASEGEA
jgi:purine-nucleoside phosphorylase